MSVHGVEDLPRRLGLLDATTTVIGTMVGGAIFIIPANIAREVPSIPLILIIWVVTGLISLFGALAYAELGAMLPHSGGQYVYLREAYGPLPAFITGWVFFLIINSGSIAAVSVVCATYLSYLLPGIPGLMRWAPVTLIFMLSAVNYLGVRQGALVQNLFTFFKLAGLALLVLGAFFFHGSSSLHWSMPESLSSTALSSAMLGAFLAYDGWHYIAFVAGEVIHPRRNLLWSLVIGVVAVMAVYLVVNIAYFHVLPIGVIAASERVAAASAEQTIGPLGAAIVTLTILLSTTGAANGAIMTSPRVYFTQARDGLFFRKLSEIHPRFLTPSASILTQGLWASFLAATGSYVTLISYVLFIAWIIHALTVLGLIVLRRKHPEWERPYRVWGYPWAPLLFVAFAAWFVVTTLAARPASSIAGMGIMAAGVPIYYFWRKRK
ncbi:MAG: amino acid permease [Bryobacterales bacterium]|nr:amino acid permease [Bryobacterales bacterium]